EGVEAGEIQAAGRYDRQGERAVKVAAVEGERVDRDVFREADRVVGNADLVVVRAVLRIAVRRRPVGGIAPFVALSALPGGLKDRRATYRPKGQQSECGGHQPAADRESERVQHLGPVWGIAPIS